MIIVSKMYCDGVFKFDKLQIEQVRRRESGHRHLGWALACLTVTPLPSPNACSRGSFELVRPCGL